MTYSAVCVCHEFQTLILFLCTIFSTPPFFIRISNSHFSQYLQLSSYPLLCYVKIFMRVFSLHTERDACLCSFALLFATNYIYTFYIAILYCRHTLHDLRKIRKYTQWDIFISATLLDAINFQHTAISQNLWHIHTRKLKFIIF